MKNFCVFLNKVIETIKIIWNKHNQAVPLGFNKVDKRDMFDIWFS